MQRLKDLNRQKDDSLAHEKEMKEAAEEEAEAARAEMARLREQLEKAQEKLKHAAEELASMTRLKALSARGAHAIHTRISST